MTPERRGCHVGTTTALHDAPPPITAGEMVTVRGELWRVRSVRAFADCTALGLVGQDHANWGLARTYLLPFDRPARHESGSRIRHVSPFRWFRAFRHALAAATPFRGLRVAATSNLDLHAWQLEPALAITRGLASRVLLADEVGLGKTVQAGLVIAELAARGQLDHALVLVPAGLRDQWAAELSERFRVEAAVMDLVSLQRRVSDDATGANPWGSTAVVVASIDFVKRPEVLRGLTAVLWDLVVVDEAHAVATAAERATSIAALSGLSRRVLLLTATPHAGDAEGFSRLCQFGRTPGEGPILLFRRTRAEVGLPSTRRVHLLAVTPTPVERQLHGLLRRYAVRVRREAASRRERAPALAMMVLQKRALSSPASLAASLERRMALLAAEGRSAATQLDLPLDDEENAGERQDEDEPPDAALAAPGLADPDAERDELARLLAVAIEAAQSDAKLHRLARLLRSVIEPVLVFTEYRDTLERLASALSWIGPMAVLHGGLSRADRALAESRFRTGQARLLLATDAAGQGLNLQHRCRLVVNVELPWNPWRLEQRIGRVDRIGQARRVHAVHFVARGTAEERILRRLVGRVRLASDELGLDDRAPGPLPATALGPAPTRGSREATEPPCIRATLVPEAAAERERLLLVRARLGSRRAGSLVLSGRSPAPPVRPLVTAVPRAALRRQPIAALIGCWPVIISLFWYRLVDTRGALVEEGLCPIAVACSLRRRSGRRALLDDVERLVSGARFEMTRAALSAVRGRAVDLAEPHRVGLVYSQQREHSILAVIERLCAERRRPIQAGLFDQRSIRMALARRAEADHLMEAALTGVEASGPAHIHLAGDPALLLVLAVTE